MVFHKKVEPKRSICQHVCLWTHWYLEQVELAMAGSSGWKVTGGLCWADIRKPKANRLKLKHVPVEEMIAKKCKRCHFV